MILLTIENVALVFISVFLMAVAGKTLFEQSILLDKTMLVLLTLCAGMELVFGCLIPSDAFHGMGLLRYLMFVPMFLIFIRGDRNGFFQRLRAFFDAVMVFYLPSGFFCFAITALIFPDQLNRDGQVETDRVLWMILAWMILFTIYLTVELLRKKIYLQFKSGTRLILFIYGILIIVIGAYFQSSAGVPEVRGLAGNIKWYLAISLLVLYIAIPLLLVKTKLSSIYDTQRRVQQELMEAELKHFEQYKETEEETRRFRHDIVNNLRIIQMLQNEEKHKEAMSYVDELLGNVSALSPKVVSGCDLLDCIVGSKMDEMEKQGIQFTMDGVLDHGLQISPVDICTIFANALDNAIEACSKKDDDRRIHMRLKRTRSFYCITIENTMESGNKIRENLGRKRFTTKADEMHHGFGLEGMRKAVKKNQGQMTTEVLNDNFLLTVMLPVPN